MEIANVSRYDRLYHLFLDSKLSTQFDVRTRDDDPNLGFSAVRVNRNVFNIRAFEIWEQKTGKPYVRIYHGKITDSLRAELKAHEANFKSVVSYSDFRGDESAIFSFFYEILSSDVSKDIAKKNKSYTKNSAYEGLELPDVDTSDTEVMGVEYSWKEIIAINEDSSSSNKLKNALSRPGIYLQRSSDGTARYVGSAYSDGGILSRWLKHLNSNGDAKHLNLYVLDNGYSQLVFTVLEFTEDGASAISSETRWKQTLGTKNTGPYDGVRLNKN